MTKQKLHADIIALCDYAIISREGKLSINGIFDELRVQKFPGGIGRAFFVATINGTPNTHYKLSLKVKEKNGAKVPFNDFNVESLTAPSGKSNIVVELLNFAFQEEGDYSFKIYHEENEVGSTLLKVYHYTEKLVNPDEKLPN